MNLSTMVSMTSIVSALKVMTASSRLRNSGLKTLSMALLPRLPASRATSLEKPIIPPLISREPAFDVMIRIDCRKSALRPVLSVSVAWSITCSRILKRSGWAFSISSSNSTQCGVLLIASVSSPPWSKPT